MTKAKQTKEQKLEITNKSAICLANKIIGDLRKRGRRLEKALEERARIIKQMLDNAETERQEGIKQERERILKIIELFDYAKHSDLGMSDGNEAILILELKAKIKEK